MAAAFAVLYIAVSRFFLTHGWRPKSLYWYDLAAIFTALVLLTRNRYPRTTLIAVAVIYPAYYGHGLISELHLLPILLAAYAVAGSGQVRALLVVIVAGIGITDLYIPPADWWSVVLHPATLSRDIWYWNLSGMGMAQAASLAVILLGRAAYKQRRSTAQLLARHREIERLRQVETDQLVTAERTRIARELHDVIAHHISAVVIRAQAADRVAGHRPEETRAAVRWIAASGQETLAAMRHVVRVLRSTETGVSLTPQATLAELPAMAERLRAVGLDVELRVPAVAPLLPAAAELAAVRIVQEALTNVLVHAQATRALVEVRLAEDQVLLDIHDNGSAGAPPTQPIERISARTRGTRAPAQASAIVSGQPLGGNGLIGMRERAASCGGWLRIRTSSLGGWQISAMLRPSVTGLTAWPVVPAADGTPATERQMEAS